MQYGFHFHSLLLNRLTGRAVAAADPFPLLFQLKAADARKAVITVQDEVALNHYRRMSGDG
jgi:hypothetical protein